jgi:hypothetical protein
MKAITNLTNSIFSSHMVFNFSTKHVKSTDSNIKKLSLILLSKTIPPPSFEVYP